MTAATFISLKPIILTVSSDDYNTYVIDGYNIMTAATFISLINFCREPETKCLKICIPVSRAAHVIEMSIQV
jgi:hypothetical protein